MLVRNKKLPLNLVKEAFNSTASKGERLLQVEGYGEVFGPQSRRKRPTLGTTSLAEMIATSNEVNDSYDAKKDNDLHKHAIADMK